MSPKKAGKLRCSFEFDYAVTSQGVPQPYPVKPPNTKVLFRLSPAEDENGRKFSVLNICGSREGLKYLAAMLVLSADSDEYDPYFHIHLEDMEGFQTDINVAIRAPSYLEALEKNEFSEFKGTSILLPKTKHRK